MTRRAFHLTAAVFAAVVFAGFLSGGLDAMNWPSETAVLFRNFGYNNGGRPVLGMVFTGGTDVLAAENGEVIFSRGVDDTASRLPSPLGAWTAVDHGDGLISIYSRYSGGSRNSEGGAPAQVERQQPIASAGVSGWSAREGFYFIVYDRRERRWINPVIVITPQREARYVQISSVELRNAQGLAVQSRTLNQGRYTILVNAYAVSAQGGVLAPQRIVCSVNGAEAGSLNFEAVSARDGVLMVYRNGLVPAKQVYANYPSFEAAEVFLNRGQANIEIIVQDTAGSTRNVVNRYSYFVN